MAVFDFICIGKGSKIGSTSPIPKINAD